MENNDSLANCTALLAAMQFTVLCRVVQTGSEFWPKRLCFQSALEKADHKVKGSVFIWKDLEKHFLSLSGVFSSILLYIF